MEQVNNRPIQKSAAKSNSKPQKVRRSVYLITPEEYMQIRAAFRARRAAIVESLRRLREEETSSPWQMEKIDELGNNLFNMNNAMDKIDQITEE